MSNKRSVSGTCGGIQTTHCGTKGKSYSQRALRRRREQRESRRVYARHEVIPSGAKISCSYCGKEWAVTTQEVANYQSLNRECLESLQDFEGGFERFGMCQCGRLPLVMAQACEIEVPEVV